MNITYRRNAALMLCAAGLIVLLCGIGFVDSSNAASLLLTFLVIQATSFLLGLSAIKEIQGKLAAGMSFAITLLSLLYFYPADFSATTEATSVEQVSFVQPL